MVVLGDASKPGKDTLVTYPEARRISKVVTAGELDERASGECHLLGKAGVEVVQPDLA